jgi:hypothetical protein
VKSIIGRLRISYLNAQIEASRLYRVELANRFENAVASAEKTMIAREYDKSLKQSHAMQLLIEVLERKSRGRPNDAP